MLLRNKGDSRKGQYSGGNWLPASHSVQQSSMTLTIEDGVVQEVMLRGKILRINRKYEMVDEANLIDLDPLCLPLRKLSVKTKIER